MSKVKVILNLILDIPKRLTSNISVFAIIKNSKISKLSAICGGTRFYNSKLDDYSYIGKRSIICNSMIGKYCSISNNVVINPGNHPIDYISTSPIFYAKKNILNKSFIETDFQEYGSGSFIGNDVWIGTGAFIKGGVTIGDGAIVGAYSVVTKDVAPYTIVAGNPARVIRKRFDEKTIENLIQIQWWNWDESKIRNKSQLFKNTIDFIDDYYKENILKI